MNVILLNENLIDEIIIFIMPIVLAEGIMLFVILLKDIKLDLITSKTYESGVVELNYIENQK
ncbi:MAG: dihydrofolate reductase [Planctomycetota bacterium]